MSGYANWNPSTTYSVNDIVDYEARIWVSLQNANFNKQPDTNPSWWSQIGGGGVISTIVAGNGITVSGAGSSRLVSTNLAAADARLTITSGVGTQLVLTNTSPAAVAAGSGLSVSGTNPTGLTLSMPNVGTSGTYAYPSSVSTDAQGRITAITAGSAPSAASPVRMSRIVLPGNNTFPIAGGASGTQGISILLGGLATDLAAGTSPDPNGVWVIDLSPFTVLLTGSLNTGFVQIGIVDDLDPGLVYNGETNQLMGSSPSTFGGVGRNGGCGAFILKVSTLLSTLPNFNASSFQSLNFANGSSDTLWSQFKPSFVVATYYPLGI